MASKERNSNLELLRIIAMLMIIAFHIYYHSISTQLTDTDSIEQMENGLYSFPIFYPQLLTFVTFAPMGKIGNAIFVLISGYFLAGRNSKIHLTATIKKLFSQQLFALVVLVLGSICCFQMASAEETAFITTIDANYFNTGMSWFVGYYFIIILLADLFLNHFLENFSRSDYGKFVLILFALVQFQWAAGLLNSLASGLKVLTTGVFLFSLGGYIRRFDPFKRVRGFVFFLIILICYFFVYFSYYALTVNEIQTYLQGSMKKDFIQVLPKYGDHYLLPLIIGICLFEIFRRIPMGSHKILNFIASSTFMIYLLHDNKFFYSLWNMTDWITLLHNGIPEFLRTFSIWVFMVFIIGFLVYCLYLSLSSLFEEFRFLFLRGENTDDPEENRMKGSDN